jgi:hypothetical protein
MEKKHLYGVYEYVINWKIIYKKKKCLSYYEDNCASICL